MITGADITVIIPTTGDRESELLQAIESVKRQEVEVASIIVVWDGNCDNPLLQRRVVDLGVLLLTTKSPYSGVSVARNVGLRKADTLYVALLDDDDYWLENKLKVQLEVLNSGHPNSLGFVGSPTYLLSEKGLERRVHPATKMVDASWSKFLFTKIPIFPRGRWISTSSYLFPKTTSNSCFFSESLKVSEDLDFFGKLGAGLPFSLTREALLVTRIRRSSKSGLSHFPMPFSEWLIWTENFGHYLSQREKANLRLVFGTKRIVMQESRKSGLVYFLKNLSMRVDLISVLTALSFILFP